MSEAKLIHYSERPIRFVRSMKQHVAATMKPEGFWFSIEDGSGWKEWCEGEEWNLESLAVATPIALVGNAKVLRLRSVKELDNFHEEFSIRDRHPMGSIWDMTFISWREVAKRWRGIIIAPYQYVRRLDYPWYYGWDCSCGCVWDASAIQLHKE